MPVTVPITVCVPDLIVTSVSTSGDLIVADCEEGPPPDPWLRENLKKETADVLLGFSEPTEEYKQLYSALMLTMRQAKRVLEEQALGEFLVATRRDAIAAFVQKYGMFKRRDTGPEKIRVSINDFTRERSRLRAILGLWTPLSEEDTDEASSVAKERGIEFGADPYFALSVHLSARLAGLSTLTLIAEPPGLKPVLYCRDVLTGLYALLFQAVVAGRPWSVCPNCENAFASGRAGKRFCSEPCQQAFKQRRYRKSLKSTKRKVRMGRRR
jgi:hypothetical protein